VNKLERHLYEENIRCIIDFLTPSTKYFHGQRYRILPPVTLTPERRRRRRRRLKRRREKTVVVVIGIIFITRRKYLLI
jgi:hypothetical protein